MNEGKIPTKINSGTEEETDFRDIYSDFASTVYGQILNKNARYIPYKPESVSNQEWEKLLGVDINNLKHLKLSYGITRQFIRYFNTHSESMEESRAEGVLTEKEQEDLLLTAIVHDWAEAIVGDIPFDQKTKAHGKEEYRKLKEMARNMFKGKNDALLERINNIADKVIDHTETKLGSIFNAIERLGYVRTALRAWQASKNSPKELQIHLYWLTVNVLPNQLAKLIEYSKLYYPVKLFLQENQELIQNALNNLPEDAFQKYKPEEVEGKRKLFEEGRKKWFEFKETIRT